MEHPSMTAHSVIITSKISNVALVWYGGPVIHWHAIEGGNLGSVAYNISTKMEWQEQKNEPTTGQAAEFMMSLVEEIDGRIMEGEEL